MLPKNQTVPDSGKSHCPVLKETGSRHKTATGISRYTRPPEMTDRPPVSVHIQWPALDDGDGWSDADGWGDVWVAMIADEIEREYGESADSTGCHSINDITLHIGVAKENVCDRLNGQDLRDFVAWIDGREGYERPWFRVRPCQCRPGAISPPLLDLPRDSPDRWYPKGTRLCVDLHITTGEPPLGAWEAEALAKRGHTISDTWHLMD